MLALDQEVKVVCAVSLILDIERMGVVLFRNWLLVTLVYGSNRYGTFFELDYATVTALHSLDWDQ